MPLNGGKSCIFHSVFNQKAPEDVAELEELRTSSRCACNCYHKESKDNLNFCEEVRCLGEEMADVNEHLYDFIISRAEHGFARTHARTHSRTDAPSHAHICSRRRGW